MNLQVYYRPRRLIGPRGPLGDDTNTPYPTRRQAARQCAAGLLQRYAAETLFRPGRGEWHGLVLTRPGGPPQYWFYRDAARCDEVFAEWAGHGDPADYTFTFELYRSTRPFY